MGSAEAVLSNQELGLSSCVRKGCLSMSSAAIRSYGFFRTRFSMKETACFEREDGNSIECDST